MKSGTATLSYSFFLLCVFLFSFLFYSVAIADELLTEQPIHEETLNEESAEDREGDVTGKEQETEADSQYQAPADAEDSISREVDDAEDLIAVFQQKGTPQGLEPARVVAILATDEYGRKITYPRGVFVDKFVKELFVVASSLKGESTIFVYDKNYFPTATLGSGRGIISPRDVAVDRDGRVYVVWIDTERTNRGRLTIFNGAFFKTGKVDISTMPDADSYNPDRVALGNNGDVIYIAGYSNKKGGAKGVLVLDSEGVFKRWLVPLGSKAVYGVSDNPHDRHALTVNIV